MVTGDNATSRAVPSLMTTRVRFKVTLGQRNSQAGHGTQTRHQPAPNPSPRYNHWVFKGTDYHMGFEWTLLLAKEDTWPTPGPASC